jgi:hypothetical protein
VICRCLVAIFVVPWSSGVVCRRLVVCVRRRFFNACRSFVVCELFVARERHVGSGFEKLLPELSNRSAKRPPYIIYPPPRLSPTLDASQTDLQCSPYCSTTGRMLPVTMRCALLKLWSISRVCVCQHHFKTPWPPLPKMLRIIPLHTLQRESDGLFQLLQLFRRRERPVC